MAARHIDALDAEGPEPLLATPQSVLLACLAAHALGQPSAAARAAAAVIVDAAAEMVAPDAVPTGPVVLGARLGLVPEPPARGAATPMTAGVVLGRPDTIAHALAAVEGATAYGTRVASAPAGVAEALDAVTIDLVGLHQLELGSRCLRARAYLDGRRTRAFTDSRYLLVLEQNEDGGFGSFEPEIAELEQGGLGLTRARLELGATLGCLWALAETGSASYRLVRDLGRRMEAAAT